MKHVLKFAISGLILFTFFSALQAQQPRGEGRDFSPEQRAAQQTALMTEKLSLSEAQTAKIKEINLKYAQKTKDARDANTGGDWSAMREKMVAMRSEQDAELKTMLTSDQWTAWEKVREEQRNNRGGRGDRGPKKDKPAGGQ